MYKQLSIVALISALTILPGCRFGRKKDPCTTFKPRKEKKAKQKSMEMANLADLYDDITEEELRLAENVLDNEFMELNAETEAPRKM